MSSPFVGPPTAGRGCAYAPEVDQPCCEAPATVHLMVESEAWGRVALASCDAHVSIARHSGTPMEEHAYAPACAAEAGCFR